MTVQGWRLYARVADRRGAQAVPIVFVHGLGVSSRYMVPTAVRLAPYAPVYVPDLPGFGRSDGPDRALNIPELGGVLLGWMDAMDLARASFVGNSFGCHLIVDLALRAPERVVRAVLGAPTSDPARRTAAQQIGALLLDGLRERPSLLPLAARDYLRAGIGRCFTTLRYLLDDPIEEKLPRVRVPTLVVRGGRDPIVPQAWAERVARLLPQGRLVIIPGAAHAVNYDRPEELARLVRAFLDEPAGNTPS